MKHSYTLYSNKVEEERLPTQRNESYVEIKGGSITIISWCYGEEDGFPFGLWICSFCRWSGDPL